MELVNKHNWLYCIKFIIILTIKVCQMKTDKDHSNLIQSLKKLIKFAANGADCQRQIFSSFNRSDFQKIMQNFDDDNQILRQLSFKLMSLLLSKSRQNRNEFCKIFEIYPVKGRVVLNKLPMKLVNSMPDAANIITKLREGHFGTSKQMYLKPGNSELISLDHREFPEEHFLDPNEVVIVTMVEDENPSPKKLAFFGDQRSSTPKRKINQKRSRSKEQEMNNGTTHSSPRESAHVSFTGKTRPRS